MSRKMIKEIQWKIYTYINKANLIKNKNLLDSIIADMNGLSKIRLELIIILWLWREQL